MSKSSLTKNQEKTVTTNLTVGWVDNLSTNANEAESGGSIYIVPKKAESEFQRMLWTVQLDQDPGSFEVLYVITARTPARQVIFASAVGLAETALLVVRQAWRSVTQIGIFDTSKTVDADMRKMVISRRNNLNDDDEYSIVPAYRSNSAIVAGQSGVLFVKETLFQEIFKDDRDEWEGYTFEESAQ